MLGAILGDIAGSVYEFVNNRVVPQELFTSKCFATDDTYLTCAVADALYKWKQGADLKTEVLVETLWAYKNYPRAGWGAGFSSWANKMLAKLNLYTYNGKKIKFFANKSAGNGAAMKVAAIPYYAESLEECIELTKIVTSVTHDHEDSYTAAECLTTSMYMALRGKTRDQIRQNIFKYYPEARYMNYATLRVEYKYTELAKDTVPQAMVCFLESDSFEDALRKAISIGGDADTLGAITGALAEAFYKWPENKYKEYRNLVDDYGLYEVPYKSLYRFEKIAKQKLPKLYQGK